ncbi:protein of unknown function (plasmid) [Shinella sp. WSC3-e]|nr:protein of unknown function [Shinella sp. WSC3-e]
MPAALTCGCIDMDNFRWQAGKGVGSPTERKTCPNASLKAAFGPAARLATLTLPPGHVEGLGGANGKISAFRRYFLR